MFSNSRDDSVVLNPFDGLALAYDSGPEREASDDADAVAGNGGFLADL